MDNTFNDDEQLYRAVYPPDKIPFFWKKNGTISDAALRDSNGLSVERGNYRTDKEVIDAMSEYFEGSIIAFSVADCREVNASVLYKPTTRSIFHTEVHGSIDKRVLSAPQRRHIIERAKIIGRIPSSA